MICSNVKFKTGRYYCIQYYFPRRYLIGLIYARVAFFEPHEPFEREISEVNMFNMRATSNHPIQWVKLET